MSNGGIRVAMGNDFYRRRALLLWQEGQKHQQVGDLGRAIDLYTKSIAIYPTAESYTFRGWAYSSQGRVDDAIKECKKAIAVDPTFGNPYNDIGSYLISQGKIDEAVEWLKKAKVAERYEFKHFPYMNLGRLYASKGLLVLATQEFQQALDLSPGESNCVAALSYIQKLLH
jgi:Tfp pilus assembly protein PilF